MPCRPFQIFTAPGNNYKTLREVQEALRKAGLESSNLIIGTECISAIRALLTIFRLWAVVWVIWRPYDLRLPHRWHHLLLTVPLSHYSRYYTRNTLNSTTEQQKLLNILAKSRWRCFMYLQRLILQNRTNGPARKRSTENACMKSVPSSWTRRSSH